MRFSKEEKDFIRRYAKGHSLSEITCAFNSKFALQKSREAIRSIMNREGIHCGRKQMHRYTYEEIEFLKTTYKSGVSFKDLVYMFNVQFSLDLSDESIKGALQRNQITNGKTGHFKKGNLPQNQLPVGSETLYKNGYVGIKVSDNPVKWMLKQNFVWEQNNGPIPEGKMIIFIDGDKQNCDISNLMIIDKSVNVIMNRWTNLPRSDGITQANVNLAKLKMAIRNRETRK